MTIFTLIFCSPILILANEKKEPAILLPEPGFSPDSYFYFLELFKERLIILFTFDNLQKADKEVSFSTERISEIKKMIEEEKWEAAKKGLQRYKINLERARRFIEKADTEGKDLRAVKQILQFALEDQLQVFSDSIKKIPEDLEHDYAETMDYARETLEFSKIEDG